MADLAQLEEQIVSLFLFDVIDVCAIYHACDDEYDLLLTCMRATLYSLADEIAQHYAGSHVWIPKLDPKLARLGYIYSLGQSHQ